MVGRFCSSAIVLCLGLSSAACSSLPFGPTPPAIADAVPKPADNDIGTFSPPSYTAAGYNLVYKKCTDYFDALILMKNQDHFGKDVMSSAGSAAAVIAAVTHTTAPILGGVAAGFGLVTNVFDSYDKNALITPYPDETKGLILQALDAFSNAAPPNSVVSPADAIRDVQHYAELCTGSGISRFAKEALTRAKAANDGGGSKSVSVLTASQQKAVQAIAVNLGAQAFTDADLALLYLYFEKDFWKKDKDTTALLSQLGSAVSDKLTAGTGKASDPTKLKEYPVVHVLLVDIFTQSKDFQSVVAATEKSFDGSGKIKPSSFIATEPPPQGLARTDSTTVPHIVVLDAQ